MNEAIPGIVKNAANVVPLSDFLKGADVRFRKAVIKALTQEKFEIDEPLPNLQLAEEILEAIAWLAGHGFGRAWRAFESALRMAGHNGVLVDLGAFGHNSRLLDEVK